METQVRELARIKQEREKLAAEYAAELALFEEQHAATIKQLKEYKETEDELKAEVEAEARSEFERTGEKKLFGGIGIRQGKPATAYIYDGTAALAFAKEKDIFLTLDKKAFEAAIPGLNVDFVETEEVPGKVTVTFPKEYDV